MRELVQQCLSEEKAERIQSIIEHHYPRPVRSPDSGSEKAEGHIPA